MSKEDALRRIKEAKENKSLTLNLGKLSLNEIPLEVFDLAWLEGLDLKNNNLTTIPSEILKLTELKGLHLNNNEIRKLPSEICSLKKLSHICLNNNKLTEIPEIFKEKKNINLQLWANNINFPPKYYLYEYHLLNKESFDWNSTYAFGFYLLEKKVEKEGRNENFSQTMDRIERFVKKIESSLSEDEGGVINSIVGYYQANTIIFPSWKVHYEINYSNSEIIAYFDGENYKQILQIIINKTNELVEQQKEFLLIKNRFFYHPKDSVKIDYDYLLTLNASGEKTYVSPDGGKKYDIQDLLSIIEPDLEGHKSKNTQSENKEVFENFKNKEEYLSNVEIKNFKIFESISLELDKDINIIMANNGLGKTSILQAITIGLLPIKNKDKYTDFNDYIRFGHEKTDVTTKWGAYERNTWFYYDELHEKEPRYNPQPLLLSYGANIFADSLLDVNEIVDKIINGDNISYSTQSIFSPSSYNRFFDPLKILNKLDSEDSRRLSSDSSDSSDSMWERIKQIVKELTTRLNYFLSLNNEPESIQVYKSEEGLYYFKGFGQEKLELKHLSEGYRNNVLIISDILIRVMSARNIIQTYNPAKKISISEVYKQTKGVIIIDEFDRHLHPTWQRKLVDALKEVFKEIQFILTTHNPVSILGRKKEQIHQLYWDDENKVSVYPYHTSGTETMDAGLALLVYYGLESILSPAMQKKVEQFNEFERNKQTDSEEYKSLKREIQDSYLGQNIKNKKYLAFIDFLKEKGIKNSEIVDFQEKLSEAEIKELEELLK